MNYDKGYFDSPVAYVFLVAFLVLVGFMTFGVAMFYERRQADLTPFFFWHPWVYLLLVPAATMGSWAEERRNGTIELLLTLPVTLTQALVGKFLAAWAFIGIGLALTFPVVATTAWLGAPDWGAVFCGYLGSFLLAGAATAIGVFASSLSRSQVIGFVAALAITFAMLLIGFDPVVNAVASWGVPSSVVNAVASCSLMSHFESLRRGVIDFADIGYYVAVMVFMLAAAHAVTDGQKKIKLFSALADQRLFFCFARFDLSADELPKKPSRLVCGALAGQKTVFIPDQGGNNISDHLLYFSNQSVISCRRRTRCLGLPERDSSWFSPWNSAMRESTPFILSAVNMEIASLIQQR